jgi:hypothetical protein
MVRPDLPCTENRNWDDGADLPQSTITYDGRGKVTAVTADANFRQVELLDVRDTTFASDGVNIGPYAGARVYGDFVNVEQNAGQFWLNVMHMEAGTSAGLSAGAQRLLTYLVPPEPLKTEDDGGGDGVKGAARIEQNLPDVGEMVKPGDKGRVGDMPLHEVVTPDDANSVISSLTGISDEIKALLRNAFLKNKPVHGSGDAKTGGGTGTTGESTGTGGST